jgi:hypothetical protein
MSVIQIPANIEMGPQAEHLSPFIEGFESDTMQTLFTEILKVDSNFDLSSGSKRTKRPVVSQDGTCPAPVPKIQTTYGSPTPGMYSSTKLSGDKIAFIKSVIKQQKESVDSLMESSKKINPVAQKIKSMDTAYDAAFETDMTAPLPNMSGTLQGFIIFFFVLSYLSMAIVVSIMVGQNVNTVYALRVFGAFMIGFIILIGLVPRIV